MDPVQEKKIPQAIVKSLRSMEDYGPENLQRLVATFAHEDSIDESRLVDHIVDAGVNDPPRHRFHLLLGRWDNAVEEEWTNGTEKATPERRQVIADLLWSEDTSRIRVDQEFPVPEDTTTTIDNGAWDPWYTKDRVLAHEFYWPHYKKVVAKKLGEQAAQDLDESTDEVIRRLSDPTRAEIYQSKGLVMGHVQSGKTANFTGVTAKAIDAGYRLVIVLTGMMDNLRNQTQRRFDMELVGRENILFGIDPTDQELIDEVGVDYASTNDQDWPHGFTSFEIPPRDVGKPSIRRLTGESDDYKALKLGLGILDFKSTDSLAVPHLGVYHEKNLFGTDVRLAVVKKNSTVLKKLVNDLKSLQTNLREIPALIIDDEADQASVNTTRPKKARDKEEEKERTSINGYISTLLTLMPRAQYVAYTATPFANVFVDPEDSQDLFPKDFIVSLTPSPAYMGGKDFHDLDRPSEDDEPMTPATSNEAAYVRNLLALPEEQDERRQEMQQAVDSFVLSGAIKLFREAKGRKSNGWQPEPYRFRHHTMLVHESMKQADHSDLAELVRQVWQESNYQAPSALQRLDALWKGDFQPVSAARAESGEAVPDHFQDLMPYIAAAIDKIRAGVSSVVVINGDKNEDYNREDANFLTQERVWKIIVGGQKLSRGFTVEGLTVSHYTRKTMAADTLMQMGRWFGYRSGYRDLIRLFIGRSVSTSTKSQKTVDLYKAFEDIVRDEEEFREELRRFSKLRENGRPVVRPADVPPMVFQRSPWLKPTAANKMYNAVETMKGVGGKVQEFNNQLYSPRASEQRQINEHHFGLARRLLDGLDQTEDFYDVYTTGKTMTYPAHYGIFDNATVRMLLNEYRWGLNWSVKPTLAFFDAAVKDGHLEDWLVFYPELKNVEKRRLTGTNYVLPIQKRLRRKERDFAFAGSSTRQRLAMEVISGGTPTPALLETRPAVSRAQKTVASLHTPTRGAMLLAFAADKGDESDPKTLTPDPNAEVPVGHVASIFYMAFPKQAAPDGKIGFTTRTGQEEDVIVDAAKA